MSVTQLPVWQALQAQYEQLELLELRELFRADPHRFDKFSLSFNDILFDYSKNLVTEETLSLLIALAEECGLQNWIKKMFNGEKINATENRSVLHVALRNRSNNPIMFEGNDVMPNVRRVLQHMQHFSDSVRNGKWLGHTGKAITDAVNIGIGGSDLGPAMVVEALTPYCNPQLRVHFVSNVDGSHLSETLARLDPQTTLFIIASKTFTTQETMLNAHSARSWFIEKTQNENAIARHFVAVSTNREAVAAFGIGDEQIFEFWDWVGGRYSLWSAVGLSIAIAAGYERFEELLQGAYEMDEHFRQAPLVENMPVILALLGIWYSDFCAAQSYAILPYDQHLRGFPAYLQQLEMESNGKRTSRDGHDVDYDTCPVVWGAVGTNGQHAFFQLLHQGTRLIPADFLAAVENHHTLDEHHLQLIANFLAQTEALMRGKTVNEVVSELTAKGYSGLALEQLVPHKIFPGNKPSNSILFQKLDPRTLGSLIALYEHKTFVQSVIWNINAFDQWGVELGKELAGKIRAELGEDGKAVGHDSSTNGLINYFNTHWKQRS